MILCRLQGHSIELDVNMKNYALRKIVHDLIKELHNHMMNLLGETEVCFDILS